MAIQTTAEDLLKTLLENSGKPLKTENLCKQLRIPPSTFEKLRTVLSRRGYTIETQDNGNSVYLRPSPDRIQPDDLLPHLKTTFIGRDLHYFPRLNSQTEMAYHLAQRYPQVEESVTPLRLSPQLPAPETERYAGNGSVIVTEVCDADTSLWASTETGINLHAAVVLRPGILPMRAAQIALVAHVAMARIIETYGGSRPHLRWPFEMTLGGKTVSRLRVRMEGNVDRINFLILGFELNLNGLLENLDSHLAENVTSLRQVSGKMLSRPVIAGALFRELEKWYITYINKGPEKILRELQSATRLDPRPVEFSIDGKSYAGTIDSIELDGSILLRNATGQTFRVATGRLFLNL